MIKKPTDRRSPFTIAPWLLFGLGTVLIIGYFSISNHYKFEETIISQTHNQLLTTARSISASLRDHTAILSRTLTIISENRALQASLRTWDPRHSRFDGTLLSDIVQAHEKDADLLQIIDRRGRVVYQYATTGSPEAPLENLAEQQDVARALRLKVPSVSEPFRSAEGELVFTTTQPIFARAEGGEFVGLARWVIKVDTMTAQFVSNVRIGESGYAQVLDGSGNLLSTPNQSQIGRSVLEQSRKLFPERDFEAFSHILSGMKAAQEGTATADLGSVGQEGDARVSRKLIAYSSIPLGDQVWSVLLLLDYSEVAGPIRASALENLLFSVCVIGTILAAGRRYFQLQKQLVAVQARQDWEDTFNTISDSITIQDNESNIIAANRAARQMLPLSSGAVPHCAPFFQAAGNPPAGTTGCKNGDHLKETQSEVFDPHLNRHIEVRVIPRVDMQGVRTGTIHVMRDISDRKLLEEELKHRALYDYLTKLPNRLLFLDRLKNLCAHLHRQPELLFAVLFIDLDHFKKINDTAGHAVGDKLLVAVAERLRQIRGPGIPYPGSVETSSWSLSMT
jgi:PAS domain-containing protein